MSERQKWISVKTPPEDDAVLCVFVAWHKPWNKFINAEVYTWGEIKAHRSWELKKSYTHWMPLPSTPES